jgi:phage protein D
MDNARRARVIIEYDGKDITAEISKGLLSVAYTDNTDKADDLQIAVEDREGNWRGPWYPRVAAQKSEG